MTGLRQRIFRQVNPAAWPAHSGLSPFNTLVCILITAAVCLTILETEKPLYDAHKAIFLSAQKAFFVFFLIEYGLRVFAAKENPLYQQRFGRLRYMVSRWALIDLLALLTFALSYLGTSSVGVREKPEASGFTEIRTGPANFAANMGATQFISGSGSITASPYHR